MVRAEAARRSPQTLRHIGDQDSADIDPLAGALALAQWLEPTLQLAPYRRHLDALVTDVRAYLGTEASDGPLTIEAARQVIARRYGYGASRSPKAAKNANIAHTINQRSGGPLPLALLYHHVFEATGRGPEIIDFPPRPLVAIAINGQRVLVDPVAGGRTLDARDLRRLLNTSTHNTGATPATLTTLTTVRPDHLTPLNPRQVLLELARQTKADCLLQRQPGDALRALQAALLMAPGEAGLWHELGLFLAHLNDIPGAIVALEHFLQLPDNHAQRYTTSQTLQSLRRRLHDSALRNPTP